MLVVKIEMWPGGYKSEAYEVGRAYVWNDATGDGLHDNYNVAICDREVVMHGGADEIAPPIRFGSAKYWTHKGHVAGFPRGPANLWPLIGAALRACRLTRKKAQRMSHGEALKQEALPTNDG